MVKVSVIIPVYNAEEYLKESVDAILNQSLEDLEVLCVDDGSTDGSLDILKEISKSDNRVKYIHQENCGGGAARNRAIPHAKGEYIYFMDADDMIDSNALMECYEIASEKRLDFLIFKAKNYAEDTGKYFETSEYSMDDVSAFMGERILSHEDLGDFIFKISVTPWCKFYNAEFVKNSGAQFAEGLIFHDNIFFYDMLFYAKRIYFYDKFLYTRRRHSASSTGAGDRRYLSIITISNMIWDIFKRHGMFDRFKGELATKKFGVVHYWYKNIQTEFKELFFCEMKEDYERIADDKAFEKYILDGVEDWQVNIYESALEAETHQEFDLMIENYNLKQENQHLKDLLDEPVYKLAISKLK